MQEEACRGKNRIDTTEEKMMATRGGKTRNLHRQQERNKIDRTKVVQHERSKATSRKDKKAKTENK